MPNKQTSEKEECESFEGSVSHDLLSNTTIPGTIETQSPPCFSLSVAAERKKQPYRCRTCHRFKVRGIGQTSHNCAGPCKGWETCPTNYIKGHPESKKPKKNHKGGKSSEKPTKEVSSFFCSSLILLLSRNEKQRRKPKQHICLPVSRKLKDFLISNNDNVDDMQGGPKALAEALGVIRRYVHETASSNPVSVSSAPSTPESVVSSVAAAIYPAMEIPCSPFSGEGDFQEQEISFPRGILSRRVKQCVDTALPGSMARNSISIEEISSINFDTSIEEEEEELKRRLKQLQLKRTEKNKQVVVDQESLNF